MRRFLPVALLALAVASSSYAQGGLIGLVNKGKDAEKKKAELDALAITDAEERRIGLAVSEKLRARFGVVQDDAIHKYVSLVGLTVARSATASNITWSFIVLDTDGVNAFAAPGGLVHVTRGLLGMVQNEAELAAVLAHEIAHVTEKHTVNALRKNKAVDLGTNKALENRSALLDLLADKAYAAVLENQFDRDDEMKADQQAVASVQLPGYSASALASFLGRLSERNKNQPPQRNGLFASHPETKDRIEKIESLAKKATTSAVVRARYGSNVRYEVKPVDAIAVDETDQQAAVAPESKGFGLGRFRSMVTKENQSKDATGSGGARGVSGDRLAKGGPVSTPKPVTVSEPELAEFKKGIV